MLKQAGFNFRIYRQRMKHWALFVALWLCSPAAGWAESFDVSLVYATTINDISIGTITYSFTIDDAQYAMSSHAKPTGMAAMFSKEELFEFNAGKLVNDLPVPQSYRFQTTKNGKKKAEYIFDFESGTLTTANQPRHIDLPTETQDELSNLLRLRYFVRGDAEKTEFPIFIARKLRSYRQSLKKSGTATVSTAVGTYDTRIVTQTSSRGKYVYRYWLASSLNDLPVKIRRQDKKGRDVVMILNSVSKRP